MATKLSLEQKVFAQKVFAAADPRRFLLAFFVLDSTPRNSTELRNKLEQEYREIAPVLLPWSNSASKIGQMCSRSLLSIGLVKESDSGGDRSEWKATKLVNELSDYVATVHEVAHNLQISTHSVFNYLAGSQSMEAPLNKALIISALAAESGYTPANPVTVASLEDRIGGVALRSQKLFGHLEQFEQAGLVVIEPFKPERKGRYLYYRWISPNPPPSDLRGRLGMAAAYLYAAVQRDPNSGVPADEFVPYPYDTSMIQNVHTSLKILVEKGIVEIMSKYDLRKVSPTRFGIVVATAMVDPIISAIRGNEQDKEYGAQMAESFRRNTRQRLLSMVHSYAAALNYEPKH